MTDARWIPFLNAVLSKYEINKYSTCTFLYCLLAVKQETVGEFKPLAAVTIMDKSKPKSLF